METSGGLHSYSKEMLKPLIELNDKINLLTSSENDINSTRLVVVGDQSHGKSSVLEALSGVDLPRGEGTKTRVPLVMRLRELSGSEKEWAEISCTRDGYERKEKIALADVSDKVEEFTSHLAGDKKDIRDEEIWLTVYRREQVGDLTLVDLPGMTRVAVDGQADGDGEKLERRIKSMYRKYIEPEESVILNVVSAMVDFETSASLSMSREVDTTGKRTMLIVTKVDQHRERGLANKVEKSIYRLNLRPENVCLVRNRTQEENDSGMTLDKAREKEMSSLYDQEGLKDLSKRVGFRLGVSLLSTKLVEIQRDRIIATLPRIKTLINDRVRELRKRNEELGRPLQSELECRLEVNRLIDDCFEMLKNEMNGQVTTKNVGPYYTEMMILQRPLCFPFPSTPFSLPEHGVNLNITLRNKEGEMMMKKGEEDYDEEGEENCDEEGEMMMKKGEEDYDAEGEENYDEEGEENYDEEGEENYDEEGEEDYDEEAAASIWISANNSSWRSIQFHFTLSIFKSKGNDEPSECIKIERKSLVLQNGPVENKLLNVEVDQGHVLRIDVVVESQNMSTKQDFLCANICNLNSELQSKMERCFPQHYFSSDHFRQQLETEAKARRGGVGLPGSVVPEVAVDVLRSMRGELPALCENHIEEVHKEIWGVTSKTIRKCVNEKSHPRLLALFLDTADGVLEQRRRKARKRLQTFLLYEEELDTVNEYYMNTVKELRTAVYSEENKRTVNKKEGSNDGSGIPYSFLVRSEENKRTVNKKEGSNDGNAEKGIPYSFLVRSEENKRINNKKEGSNDGSAEKGGNMSFSFLVRSIQNLIMNKKSNEDQEITDLQIKCFAYWKTMLKRFTDNVVLSAKVEMITLPVNILLKRALLFAIEESDLVNLLSPDDQLGWERADIAKRLTQLKEAGDLLSQAQNVGRKPKSVFSLEKESSLARYLRGDKLSESYI